MILENTLSKYIIAGGRNFDDKPFLYKECNAIIGENAQGVMIITGGQRTWNKVKKCYYGADYFGEQFANDNGYWLKVMNANWNDFGKAAGPIRNKEMGTIGDELIAFWDGQSRGTANMIDIMKRLFKPVHIIMYADQ
jgi:hypothetical protein